MNATMTADVVVVIDGRPFNIAQALYEVRSRVALIRRLELQARQLHAAAAALLLAADDEAA